MTGMSHLMFKFFKLILSGKSNVGYCHICEHRTIFIKWDQWLRDNYFCIFCRSIPRQRALVKILNSEFPNWRHLLIHESSPSGASSDKIKRECTQYEPSQYWPDLQPGTVRNGQRCENLEKMTYTDESFDLVITQDVFEHVLNPSKAFAEIARILKPGGAHIFTVPCYHGRETVVRAVETPSGSIGYLREPVYHSNPIDPKGSLVITDWGDDLSSFIEVSSNMKTDMYQFDEPRFGLVAEFLNVFVSRKI